MGSVVKNRDKELHCRWGHEHDKNKLVERKALVYTVEIKSADFKDKFLFWDFSTFCVPTYSIGEILCIAETNLRFLKTAIH